MKRPTTDLEAFFESKVRPIIVARCLNCHGEKDSQGDIRLDSAEALLRDGADALLKPGEPAQSKLFQAIQYNGETKMPPDGKLPEAEIQILHEWILRGAPFPAGAKPVSSTSPEGIALAKKTHWSLKPVAAPRPPAVRYSDWARSPIDCFIAAQLDANGLSPSPAADRRTLLRRLSFDLIGLPPSYEELQAFEEDASPDAVEKVIDRLLASPLYGERWGRHWLDVARYSDTKGYVFTEERRYPFSFTYRDYVVSAFNKDLPFDRFVLEQLAADQLELGDDQSALAAMGFLTVGRRFSNNQNDIIDDRIDVVSRGLLGLSVTCARCHDHKYDPIPTDDYYSLYGVFASSFEPGELPLLGSTKQTAEYHKFAEELQKLEKNRDDFLEKKRQEFQNKYREKTDDYLWEAWQRRGQDVDEKKKGGNRDPLKPHPMLVRRWSLYLKKMTAEPDAVFIAWSEFAKLPEKEFDARSAEVVKRLKTLPVAPETSGRINPLIQKAFVTQRPKSMRDVAAKYGFLLKAAEGRWQKLPKPADKLPTALPEAEWEELRQVLYRDESPAIVSADDMKRLMDRAARQELTKRNNAIEKLKANSPAAPPRGMVLNDSPQPVEPVVFIRGNAGRPGNKVPRRFPQAVGDFGARPFQKGSGRLELAQAIASPQSPLTARVIVNRVWTHHFGAGIVRTPSDFGIRGTPPTHPELLDYLATWFMRHGWSLKALHRHMLLSATYQQSGALRADAYAKDPENKLLWRMNPTRLEFEPMRDSWLAAAGNLDLQIGGRGFEIMSDSLTSRRSIYAFIDRQDLPQLFRTFDFASPDVSTAQRAQTTIPQQALFGMNSPFLIAQSRALARSTAATDPAERLRNLYRKVFVRDPSAEELQLAKSFVQNSAAAEPADDVASAWQYGYGTVDVAAKIVSDFHPFPQFVDQRWGGAKLPDEKIGWVHVTSRGGHPGQDKQHAAVRRWVAPAAAEIEIRGDLGHPADQGDGVRGWIISSRQGALGEWSVKHGNRATNLNTVKVEPGETIDFVVDCLGSQDHDGFTWAPVIKTRQTAGSPASVVQVWHSANDFSGPAPPRLDAWEQLAQTLLLSNEFVFVD